MAASQTISAFSTISSRPLAESPFSVTAPTASSGLPVTLSVKSGPATISGNIVTLTGEGVVTLAANQSGNGQYAAAAEMRTVFAVTNLKTYSWPQIEPLLRGDSSQRAKRWAWGFLGKDGTGTDAWIKCIGGVFWMTEGASTTRVVKSTDFNQIEFLANDWVLFTPSTTAPTFQWRGIESFITIKSISLQSDGRILIQGSTNPNAAIQLSLGSRTMSIVADANGAWQALEAVPTGTLLIKATFNGKTDAASLVIPSVGSPSSRKIVDYAIIQGGRIKVGGYVEDLQEFGSNSNGWASVSYTPPPGNDNAGILSSILFPALNSGQWEASIFNASGKPVVGEWRLTVEEKPPVPFLADVAVSSITRSGTTATITTSTPHGGSVGRIVNLQGASQSEYNGNFVVRTVPSTTSFTVTVSGTPSTPATGTIVCGMGMYANLNPVINEIYISAPIPESVPTGMRLTHLSGEENPNSRIVINVGDKSYSVYTDAVGKWGLDVLVPEGVNIVVTITSNGTTSTLGVIGYPIATPNSAISITSVERLYGKINVEGFANPGASITLTVGGATFTQTASPDGSFVFSIDDSSPTADVSITATDGVSSTSVTVGAPSGGSGGALGGNGTSVGGGGTGGGGGNGGEIVDDGGSGNGGGSNGGGGLLTGVASGGVPSCGAPSLQINGQPFDSCMPNSTAASGSAYSLIVGTVKVQGCPDVTYWVSVPGKKGPVLARNGDTIDWQKVVPFTGGSSLPFNASIYAPHGGGSNSASTNINLPQLCDQMPCGGCGTLKQALGLGDNATAIAFSWSIAGGLSKQGTMTLGDCGATNYGTQDVTSLSLGPSVSGIPDDSVHVNEICELTISAGSLMPVPGPDQRFPCSTKITSLPISLPFTTAIFGTSPQGPISGTITLS